MRLTEKDEQGNWCVKGLPWKNLYAGTPITKETQELLYGALRKLKDYEDTGLSPDEVENVNDFVKSQIAHLLKKYREEKEKHEWIPCSERLPGAAGFYLVTKKQRSGEIQVALGSYQPLFKSWSGNGNFKEVLAWMPLSEPYKG